MKIINTGIASAIQNMAIDYELLRTLESSQEAILHLYDWEAKCATYGHFLKPQNFFKDTNTWQLAKRPTGGGIVFHEGDFAFSILIPANHPLFSINTLMNYSIINYRIAKIISNFKQGETNLLINDVNNIGNSCSCFCMAKPTKYDVLINGKKVGGAAQRQTKFGFLHQGTIFLHHPPLNELANILIDGEKITEAMKQQSYPLLNTSEKINETKSILKNMLLKEFSTI